MSNKGLEYYMKSYSVRDEVADKCVSLIQPSISGGRISNKDVDILKDHVSPQCGTGFIGFSCPGVYY